VTEAAFESARAAARSSTPYATAQNTAQNFGNGYLAGWKNNVKCTLIQSPSKPGDPLTVQVTYPVPQLFTIFKTPDVTAKSTQILEEMP
jgi:hypothetical protein